MITHRNDRGGEWAPAWQGVHVCPFFAFPHKPSSHVLSVWWGCCRGPTYSKHGVVFEASWIRSSRAALHDSGAGVIYRDNQCHWLWQWHIAKMPAPWSKHRLHWRTDLLQECITHHHLKWFTLASACTYHLTGGANLCMHTKQSVTPHFNPQ